MAPTRTNCRWSIARSPTAMRNWPRRPTGSCPIGRRITKTTCKSCCPTHMAPPASSQGRRAGYDAWTGIRVDSKEPIAGGEEAIRWWKERGQDPQSKLDHFFRRFGRRRDRKAPSTFLRARQVGFWLGNAAHQRFSRLPRRPQARSDLDRLQGDGRQRTADGEDIGQPNQGDGPPRRDRTLQARVQCRTEEKPQPVLV